MRKTLFFVYYFIFQVSFAQEGYMIKLISDDTLLQSQFNKELFPQIELAQEKIQKTISHYIQKGFIASSVDSLYIDSLNKTIYLKIYKGKRYYWSSLNLKQDGFFLNSIKKQYDTLFHSNQVLNTVLYESLFRDILTHYENTGYPFVKLNLKNITINYKKNSIIADLNIELGKQYLIDSIKILGDVKISKNYIQHFLNIFEKDLYNNEKIKKISTKISNSSFLKLTKQPELVFYKNECHLYTFLSAKQSNLFQGIVGLLTDETSKKTYLTGEAKIKTQNILYVGESIHLDWNRPNKSSQNLKLSFQYPYLLNLPIQFNFDFNLNKRDSLFNQLSNSISLQYISNEYSTFNVFYQNVSNSTIKNMLNTKNYPINTSSKVNYYGFEYEFKKIDYIWNPTKGIKNKLSIKIGNKKINPSNEQKNFILTNQLLLESIQYILKEEFDLYIPLPNKFVIKNSILINHIENKNLYKNEVFRIGGIHSLRGINDQSIFASSYAVSKIELRYLFELNSFFSFFFDQAWYELNIISEFETGTPFGFGFGSSFELKSGILNFNYSFGKLKNQPINIKTGKIYFGFTSFF